MFGLDGDAEALFRTALRCKRESVRALSDLTGLPEPKVRDRLQDLVDLGLVRLVKDEVYAEPPDLTLGRLVSERARTLQTEEDRLATVRAAIPEFVSAHQEGRPGDWEPVPVDVVDSEVLVDTMETLIRNSRGELLFLRPDQFFLPSGQRMDEIVVRALNDGRVSRAIYPLGIDDELPIGVKLRVAAGERVRAVPLVPVRLAIFGWQALVVPENWETPVGRGVVVRQPAMIGALIALFEAYWERAVAVPGLIHADDQQPDELLALLARGAKDEQIARLLGISLRTVRRRIAAVLDELGAESRFQAGMEAVRRGWL